MSDRKAARGRRSALVAVAGVAALLAVGAYFLIGPSGRHSPRGADPADSAQVALGRQVYAASCASCHGDRLQGQPDWQGRRADGKLPAPPHDTSGHTWHHADQNLFDITKFGLAPYAPKGYVSDMAAYEGVLTDDQIWAVLAYIKSSWPPEIRERQARINRRQ